MKRAILILAAMLLGLFTGCGKAFDTKLQGVWTVGQMEPQAGGQSVPLIDPGLKCELRFKEDSSFRGSFPGDGVVFGRWKLLRTSGNRGVVEIVYSKDGKNKMRQELTIDFPSEDENYFHTTLSFDTHVLRFNRIEEPPP